MAQLTHEEKSPLLLYFVEREDLSKTNKRLYFDKGRFHGITTGATAVIRQFPNYIGTCWVATALTGLLFFMLFLLLLSAITNGGYRIPRCVVKEEINNNTIHLVHYHEPNKWDSIEVELFEKIIQNYPTYKVHLILIQPTPVLRRPKYERNILKKEKESSDIIESKNTTPKSILEKNLEKVIAKRDTKGKRRTIDEFLNINMSAKRLLDILLHGSTMPKSTETARSSRSIETTTEKFSSVENLLQIHPNILLENTTFNQIFYASPLYAYWPLLNENLKVFAVRVLQLWQFGGISFDLDSSFNKIDQHLEQEKETDNQTDIKDIDNIFNKRLLNFIISEKQAYEKLPSGVVTADDEALHMESKIPCHAFFGEIIMNLRKAHNKSTVKDIIQESTKIFCKHSAADKKYCDSLKNGL